MDQVLANSALAEGLLMLLVDWGSLDGRVADSVFDNCYFALKVQGRRSNSARELAEKSAKLLPVSWSYSRY